jgi:ribonucleotide monophosphatase NagD (HAD superfamily)
MALQVYVIGESGILEELDLKGIQHLGGPEDADKVVALKKGEYMEHDEDVSGLLSMYFCWSTCCYLRGCCGGEL